jgi:D-alanine--poly(phosphoribitol) ligase subunit 1
MRQINALDYLYKWNKSESATAVTCRDKSIDYKTLKTSVSHAACHLRSITDGLKGPVAVLLERSIEAIVIDLAVLESGSYFTNIDPKSPEFRFQALINNLDNPLIITTEEMWTRLSGTNVTSRVVFVSDIIHEISNCGLVNDSFASQGEENYLDMNPICIYNTSGSTGTPKSVLISHAGVIDYVDWVTSEFEFSENEVFGSITPFHFDHFTLDLFVALKIGAKIVIIPEEAISFPSATIDLLCECKVTFLFWVPTLLGTIANYDLLNNQKLDSITKIFFAGEVLAPKHLRYWQDKLPKATFVNLYGPTEATTDCTFMVINRQYSDEEKLPIGKPCRNSDVFILDPDNEIAEIGVEGEICIRGISLALGYYNNPEKTAESFVQNPLNSSFPERIYRTGDLGVWDENGDLNFIGRKDFQIKHQGYRIELAEIENASNSVFEIRNSCCLYDKATSKIVLVYEADYDLNIGELRKELSRQLPKYMLPQEAYRVSDMPKSSNGKIDRNSLSQKYLS